MIIMHLKRVLNFDVIVIIINNKRNTENKVSTKKQHYLC